MIFNKRKIYKICIKKFTKSEQNRILIYDRINLFILS